MTRYSDHLSNLRLFKNLAQEKKIRYLKAVPGPTFTIEFPDYRTVDPILLALFIASSERAFNVNFVPASGGYGCFKVTYTVVAESRDEAERIARFMSNSKKIKSLAEQAVSTKIVVQSLTAGQRAQELLRDLSQETMERQAQVNGALSIVEEELGLEAAPDASAKERFDKLQESKVKNPPPAESSFWKLGDFIGSLVGGFTKSMGG